jgi:nucleotide-binding universal stress UspA family protein
LIWSLGLYRGPTLVHTDSCPAASDMNGVVPEGAAMKILLPVDGSAHALGAVEHALGLVRNGLHAEFVLANVQEPANLYEMVVVHDAQVIEQLRSAAGAELLQPAEALLEQGKVEWESEVVGGQPGHVLVDMIERYRCDAVIMGLRGAGERPGHALGSVCQALLLHAQVPVTVVRHTPVDAEEQASDEGG